jgi:GntP family gluconate:H+ symporter
MNPILILLIGMVIVVLGVLVLRLHAFLTLIIAALVVAFLSSADQVKQSEIDTAAVTVRKVNEDGTYLLKPGKKQKVVKGSSFVLGPKTDIKNTTGLACALEIVTKRNEAGFMVVRLSDVTAGKTIIKGDRVLHHTQLAAAGSTSNQHMGKRVAKGFGNTCLGIGILIAMAAIIGKCLMESGSAERIVLSMRNLVGEKRTPIAFVGSGFLIGIPVFFDTLFYLLMPLGKALRVRTGKDYLFYVLTIVAGGTMAHSLVPPTPGPLFVADELGVDLGLMIVGGCVVGLFTVTAGYLFAGYANRKMDVPLRESAEMTHADMEAMANRDESTLPPLWLAVMPIMLPVLLLAGSTGINMVHNLMAADRPGWLDSAKSIMGILGDKNIALSLGAAVALLVLVKQKHPSKKELAASVQLSLASGGIIILITAAGGAFGHVLRQTAIAGAINDMVPASPVGLLPVAFIVCTIIRTAQGSATVAMITTVGIIGPIAGAADLTFHPLYIALAIGCGSKPISWMNDSGFWVISKMSGLTEAEMLKTNTIMGCIMASVGLTVCMIGAWLIPLEQLAN